jgi:hypothetical protein
MFGILFLFVSVGAGLYSRRSGVHRAPILCRFRSVLTRLLGQDLGRFRASPEEDRGQI